jgi:hypothetical protein
VTTLYLDHHILIKEDNWPLLREIVEQRNAIIAISNWNMVEIEQATDAAQKERRMEFVNSLAPLYVYDMLTLQKYELRNFMRLYHFNAGFHPFRAFTSTFATYIQENFGLRVRHDYSLQDYFRNARQGQLAPVAAGQREMVEALQALQPADKKLLEKIEEETFNRYVASKLPKVAPDGNPISDNELSAMAQLCWKQQSTLYRLCPAVFAEALLGERRRQDPGRRPKLSDAADLMHCTVGLSYCDAFVTNDGFAYRCCEFAKTEMTKQNLRSANLFRSLQDFMATI